MTMLTMQTKHSKIAPEMQVRRTEVYTCSKSWPIHHHSNDADRKRKNCTRKAGASNRVDTCGGGKIWTKLETNRIHDPEWTNYEKTQRTKDGIFPKNTNIFHRNFGILESVVIDTFQLFYLPKNPFTIYQEMGILERWQSRDSWYQFSKFLVLWLDKSQWRIGKTLFNGATPKLNFLVSGRISIVMSTFSVFGLSYGRSNNEFCAEEGRNPIFDPLPRNEKLCGNL